MMTSLCFRVDAGMTTTNGESDDDEEDEINDDKMIVIMDAYLLTLFKKNAFYHFKTYNSVALGPNLYNAFLHVSHFCEVMLTV